MTNATPTSSPAARSLLRSLSPTPVPERAWRRSSAAPGDPTPRRPRRPNLTGSSARSRSTSSATPRRPPASPDASSASEKHAN